MALWNAIVCGIDAHPASAGAVRVAAQLARDEAAELVLLHVAGEASEAPADAIPRLAALAADVRGGPVRLELKTGDPAHVLLGFAESAHCDLIVVGSAAHSRAALALASVAGEVVAAAKVPVIVVPVGGEDLRPDFPGQAA